MQYENHVAVCEASYTQSVRSLQNVFGTRKHVRNETCVEVYSHCCGHFTRKISHVSRFEPFHTKSSKITKSNGFSRKKIFNEKIVRTAKCMYIILVQRNFSRETAMKHVCSCMVGGGRHRLPSSNIYILHMEGHYYTKSI